LAQAEAFRLKQQQEAKEREARQAEQLRRIQEQEEARIRAERERAALQAQAHAPQKAAGQVVREEWEITISNPHALAVAHPDCVKIEPRLQVIKAKLDAGMQLPGVSAYKRATSGVRAGRTIEV
jgi:ATPase subunit of ABC transporter with duplicated ATPase domains